MGHDMAHGLDNVDMAKCHGSAARPQQSINIINCVILSDPERVPGAEPGDTLTQSGVTQPLSHADCRQLGDIDTVTQHFQFRDNLNPSSNDVITLWSGEAASSLLPAVTSVQCSLSVDCDLIFSRFRHL